NGHRSTIVNPQSSSITRSYVSLPTVGTTMTATIQPTKKIPRSYIYFFGSFGGILFGYDIGVMTGALPFLQSDWNLQDEAAIIGWITSSLMLGAVLGGVLAGQLSD